jgi:hypothetical protein
VYLAFEESKEMMLSFHSVRDVKAGAGFLDDESENKVERLPARGTDTATRPLLNVDPIDLLNTVHPVIGPNYGKEKALQMVVFWHRQVLETREIEIGSIITWDFHGDSHDLGIVSGDKTKIEIPKGCRSADGGKFRTLMITPEEPVAFRAGSYLTVMLRYVPKSKELPGNLGWVEQKLVDPLLLSSTVHGTFALLAVLMAVKHQDVKPEPEKERFASIIVAPTPLPVAVVPTPVPTPEPTPMPAPSPPVLVIAPTPTPRPISPPKIVKIKEKIKSPEIKKVVVKSKPKEVAVARKEDPAPKKVEAKKQIVADTPEPVRTIASIPPEQVHLEPAPPPPPAPTPLPTPVFEAKKVGALGMLANLHTGPASSVPNAESIQISRTVASVDPAANTGGSANNTGDIEAKLSQAAHGSGDGNGIAGVAVEGKEGSYNIKGLKGGAGKRKIRGSIVGGATFTDNSKSEGLGREQVMKIVQQHQSEIQTCYERSLMTNPDLSGRADFEWQITPTGEVASVTAKEATLRDGASLIECVKGVFAKMQFPAAKNGESTTPTIGLPFGRL